jgi:hypothetical protein
MTGRQHRGHGDDAAVGQDSTGAAEHCDLTEFVVADLHWDQILMPLRARGMAAYVGFGSLSPSGPCPANVGSSSKR